MGFLYCVSGIAIHKWNDNSVVHVATNFDQVHPLRSVSRYSQEKKKKITVSQPKSIYMYNQFMGGIDRADQNISLYRTSIRGKKWYFPLLVHLIDVAEHNAWHLSRKDGKSWDHLAFRRILATNILQSNQRIIIRSGRKSKSNNSVDPRFDGINHFIVSLACRNGKKIQLCCKLCNKKATTKCVKCNDALHVDCFLSYHTR